MTEQMKSIRIHRAAHNADEKWFLESRATAQDITLSYDALGMLTYILSKPTDWVIQPNNLKRHDCGKNKVYRVLHELIEKRYAMRTIIKDEKQIVRGVDYEIFEEPLPQNQEVVNGVPENNPLPASPVPGNGDITEYKEEQNTDQDQENSIPGGIEFATAVAPSAPAHAIDGKSAPVGDVGSKQSEEPPKNSPSAPPLSSPALDALRPCPTCNAIGYRLEGREWLTCRDCAGTGIHFEDQRIGNCPIKPKPFQSMFEGMGQRGKQYRVIEHNKLYEGPYPESATKSNGPGGTFTTGEQIPAGASIVPRADGKGKRKARDKPATPPMPDDVGETLAVMCYNAVAALKVNYAVLRKVYNKMLIVGPVSLEDVKAFKTWWYANAWQGKDKGQPPTPWQVAENWPTFKEGKNGSTSSSAGTNFDKSELPRTWGGQHLNTGK